MLQAYYKKDTIEAGCDEAGRGCLCGPVVAAAVIFPKSYNCDELNDSKKLSEKKRYEIRKIIEQNAIAFEVAFVDQKIIDEINILNASILAMHKALEKLNLKPELILVDGNKFKPFQNIPHNCIIKGDAKFQSIAAASILAKTYRDDYMQKLDLEYPKYNWKQNKGYPTKEHRNAIEVFGTTIHHRLSYKLLENQIKIPFND